MQGSKAKSGLAEPKSNGKAEAKGKGTPPTPKAEKARKPAVPKASSAHGTPPSATAPRSADKSPASADRKAAPPKSASRSATTTPPEKQGKGAKPAAETKASVKPTAEAQAAKPSQELQAKLAAVQEELKKAKDELVEKEKEKGEVLQELDCAKRVADEANAKLQEAQSRDVEGSATEKLGAVESEQASIESAQSKEDEMRKKLESMQSQQEADMAALRSTVEQLENARYELADAIDAKNMALNQADDAARASQAIAEKIELLDAEVARLKGLLDSEVESKSKEAADRIRNIEVENSELKLELEKAKVAEKKVVELEGVIELLKVDVAGAKKAGSRAGELTEKWKKKALELEARLEEADESNNLKGESLDSAMKELDATHTLIQDKESEINVLHDKVRSLEGEVARQKGDIEVSSERLDTAEKEAIGLRSEIEGLKLKLQEAQEDLDYDKVASSEIEALTEQKNTLVKELEASRDEAEKSKKGMDGMASALHELSAELREAQEKYLIKQEEIEHARAQVEELNVSLQNAKESYEVKLDEANYDNVCLKKSVERMEAEAKIASQEWQSKELSFVNSVKKAEEEIINIRVQMDKTLEVVEDRENENAELQGKMKHLEAQVTEANRTSEEAKTETIQWKEKLLDKENELQNIKQENVDLQAKEFDASEKIKELSSLLAGATNVSNKEEDNVKGDSEDDEPVMVVAKMWENSKVTDYSSSKEKETDVESEVDLESNKGDAVVDSNGLHLTKENNGSASPTKQQQHKKKPLLKKFGGLLKKKSQT